VSVGEQVKNQEKEKHPREAIEQEDDHDYQENQFHVFLID